MATHSGHPHGQHVPASSAAMSYPQSPPSPTLTNPDMILPDYEHTSSPDRSQSPMRMWTAPLSVNDMQFHLPLQNAFPSGPVTPTTPIIYGNGTMLSDIGEVTEVESNAGVYSPPSSRGLAYSSNNDAALRSSPTMGAQVTSNLTKGASTSTTNLKHRFKAVARERSNSIESTSTVTTHEPPAVFADFDDSVSVGDSNFQGDDEESLAESYADDAFVHSTRSHDNGSGLNEENRFSTSSIGRHAELILANAKRRLTTMEGNLSRARSSLYINSTLSSDGSIPTPSPPILSPHSASSEPNAMASKPGHSRMPSDNLIQADTNTSPPNAYPRRSASALGAAGGYRQPLTSSKSVDTLKLGLRGLHKSSHQFPDHGLQPLSEYEDSIESSSRRTSAHLEEFLSPTFGSGSESRPGSAAQMRELKEQMQGLKGRISSLREQARADSLKRRSLQSLRTPSPFTHAQVDQWYSESEKTDAEKATAETNPWNGEESGLGHAEADKPKDDATPKLGPKSMDESSLSEYEMAPESAGLKPPSNILDSLIEAAAEPVEELAPYDSDDLRTEDGLEPLEDEELNQDGDDGDDISDYISDSGDSLYHDAQQMPLSHEDREDAFDYEHFFLHSAMGTLSRQRRGSFSSEDSVETTRGPTSAPTGEEIRLRHHNRRGSGDTTSTMQSFATADEGKNSAAPSTSTSTLDASTEATSDEVEESEVDNHASFESASYEEYVNGLRARRRHNSVIHRPTSGKAYSLHRPSVSSFESTGTNRSFPLVNGSKTKMSGGVPTPQGSPDQELKNISDTIMSEAASACEKEGVDGSTESAIQSLPRDDQILVQRLVASMGRCVLGLSESGLASAERRLYRRRLDQARQLLEGFQAAAGSE